MKSAMRASFNCLVICVVLVVVTGDESNKNVAGVETIEGLEEKGVGRMLEEGRTLVHHAMKRFMIILPAIFFKLGTAFTMLVLVTIVSVNNGFIGFLLLVVGLSSVLARLQEPRKPAVVPYINPLPVYHGRIVQDWERRDRGGEGAVTRRGGDIQGGEYAQQNWYSQAGGYNPAYFVQKV